MVVATEMVDYGCAGNSGSLVTVMSISGGSDSG